MGCEKEEVDCVRNDEGVGAGGTIHIDVDDGAEKGLCCQEDGDWAWC